MATPHCAIAQAGSAAATAANAFSASSYQNEWSRATARANGACDAGAQEVGNVIVPSFSGRACWWCGWSFSSRARPGAARARTTGKMAMRGMFMLASGRRFYIRDVIARARRFQPGTAHSQKPGCS